MDSIQRRVAALEAAMRQQNEETTYEVWLITCYTRTEAAAFQQYKKCDNTAT